MALKPKDAPDLGRFTWDDPFLLEEQLSDDERMIMEIGRAHV